MSKKRRSKPPTTSTETEHDKIADLAPWWLEQLLVIMGMTMASLNVFVERSRNGPPSNYLIELDDKLLKILLQWASSRTMRSHLGERARAMLLAHAGVGIQPSADLIGRSRETVREWRKCFLQRGLEGLKDRKRERNGPFLPQLVEIAITSYIIDTKAHRQAVRNAEREGLPPPPQPHGLPQSRLSTADIHRLLLRDFGEDAPSLKTVRRWLKRQGLRPWLNKGWIHIRDPHFWEKASVVLDLYNGFYNGEKLGEGDLVVCSDELTQLQVMKRTVTGPGRGRVRRVEHEYDRDDEGVLKMHAARIVNTGQVFHRFVAASNLTQFRAFVEWLMDQEPFKSAKRVFWVVDNGGCHHPSTFGPWLTEQWSERAIAVHTPAHASWLNQIECFFSTLVRKALTPRNFGCHHEMMTRIDDFIEDYNSTCKPFEWTYTKQDLDQLLERLRELGVYPPPRGPLEIRGIGPEYRKRLLDAFGTIEGIRSASRESIMALPRFGPVLTDRVIAHLTE